MLIVDKRGRGQPFVFFGLRVQHHVRLGIAEKKTPRNRNAHFLGTTLIYTQVVRLERDRWSRTAGDDVDNLAFTIDVDNVASLSYMQEYQM